MPETSSPSITSSAGVRCQRSALNCFAWPDLGSCCVHASDPHPRLLSLIHAVTKADGKVICNICIFVQNMQKYTFWTQIWRTICIFSWNKYICAFFWPCTASDNKALASFRKQCVIRVLCDVGPWLVFPPCPLTQSLCRFSGPSTFIFSVSPHLRMSFGTFENVVFRPASKDPIIQKHLGLEMAQSILEQ